MQCSLNRCKDLFKRKIYFGVRCTITSKMMCRSILHVWNLGIHLEIAPCGEVVKNNFELGILSFLKVSRYLNLDLFFSYCNPRRPLESVTALLSALSTHLPSLKKVVQWCISQNSKSNVAPKEVRTLLISLAKPSPVLCFCASNWRYATGAASNDGISWKMAPSLQNLVIFSANCGGKLLHPLKIHIWI